MADMKSDQGSAAATKPASDREAQDAVEGQPDRGGSPGAQDDPSREQRQPAGPHADPALTAELATPGAGTVTPVGRNDETDAISS